MVNESITSRQAIMLIVLFIFGSSVVVNASTIAKQDSWIALIIATVASIPFILMYARIIKFYPGEGFYDIIYKLYGKVIDKLKLLENGKLCVMKLTKAMLEELNLEASDTSDIISLGMDISSVEVAALLKETDSNVKISLRSKRSVDVRKVAENFGGGGHMRAAGLTLDSDIESSETIIINAIKKELI
jgi:nanoRNase/pAp phosphatase (c-di-AMP/oligoRNAs hydrolase)